MKNKYDDIKFADFVETTEKTENMVDEVLRAARFVRHEKGTMSDSRLHMILDHAIQALNVILWFIIIVLCLYYSGVATAGAAVFGMIICTMILSWH